MERYSMSADRSFEVLAVSRKTPTRGSRRSRSGLLRVARRGVYDFWHTERESCA
jgi:hypothetical protein